MIEIEGLSKHYGDVRALQDVTLSIGAGGIVGLLGPNGAGKTTLVESIEGLRRPTAGTLLVLGLDPAGKPRRLRERIGVQLQATTLPPELTALETLGVFAAFYDEPLRPVDVLARVGLESRSRVRNRALSGGQQRRLAIGMALVNDPELIILDEPTSGLDPAAREKIHHLISDLRDAGRTVILTTHYIEEAEELCDRVLILRSGEIVADDTPLELIARAGGESSLWIAAEGELDASPLLAAGAVERAPEGRYRSFSTPDATAAILALGDVLREGGTQLTDVRMKRPGLKDVYLELVGAAGSEDRGRP